VKLRYADDCGTDGFSWIVDEPMTRTSHALCADDGVWLVDPVDWPEAVERASGLGTPAGVLQLLDRHGRDCAAIAARLGVPHLVAPASVPDSSFEVIEIKRSKRWQEVALWWPATATLVVAEALGTNAFFPVGDDLVGVHGVLKLTPPRTLLGFAPRHLLVGHGEGVHGDAAAPALRRALQRSRLSVFPWGLALPLRIRKLKRQSR
jgi:hypothetical protein